MSEAIPADDHEDTVIAWRKFNWFDPINRRRLSAPGLRTFLRIADQWGLTKKQRLHILGCPYHHRYKRWCDLAQQQKQLTLSVDVLMRISAILGIYRELQILFADETLAVEWLHNPHNAIVFGGLPPLDLVTCGTQDGLLIVLRFLDGACSGRYMLPDKPDVDFLAYDEADILVRLSRDN